MGIAGVNVYLETLGGAVVASTTSAGERDLFLQRRGPGTYQVVEGKPNGYTLENGTVGSAGGSAGVGSITSISLSSGVNATGYNLAQFKTASPCGYYCGSAGQWQIMGDCGWWSNRLGTWLSRNCASLCGSSGWGRTTSTARATGPSPTSATGCRTSRAPNSMQCQMLNAALDQYFGKC